MTPSVTTTEPSAPRVTATIEARPRTASMAASKLSVSYSEVISASLANRISTSVSMKPFNAGRWRSTMKLSDRVRAISRAEARAKPAALAKARRASSGSNR